MEANPLVRPSYEEILERIKTRYIFIFTIKSIEIFYSVNGAIDESGNTS